MRWCTANVRFREQSGHDDDARLIRLAASDAVPYGIRGDVMTSSLGETIQPFELVDCQTLLFD
jgi:hypothetical protein